ncbi:hypothetical protein ATPR_2902 [Acetobacter tropicalis NBRC 101654]|uniref:Uncharacterized protein n=1 Tax=Acetobacter tropicalis NBRC 101654 TaxID=749388 RepID=F7VHQ3_9PROT|nr:hypothetical protein ATPR_2902 [Acetobacter tropicalis NBRC 101654]
MLLRATSPPPDHTLFARRKPENPHDLSPVSCLFHQTSVPQNPPAVKEEFSAQPSK